MHPKKHKFLTLREKSDIVECLRKGEGVTFLARKYGVSKSTICGINNNKRAISKFVNNTFTGPGKRKTLRHSEYPKMEKSLYRWFLNMRDKKLPVSGLMLKEKAKDLHSKIKENCREFNASDGWLQNFKKRYGVRLLQVSGEKLSSQPQLVDPFKKALKMKMEELGLSREQLYNADESGLYWKLLPQKTYVSTLEKTAPGAKMEKQRVTFLCGSNASGSHQLKLLVLGKAKNPRCFKGFDCPVYYRHSKSAWMTAAIFKDWFHRSFIPEVIKFLNEKRLPVKALLLIDNAPSHPPEDELKSEDGCILAMFMPPNVTPLIQPMDQNAIRITKLYYRNSLLSSVAAKGFDLLEALKQITLKEAIITLESAWNKVDPVVLSKCWSNVLSMVENQEDPEDSIPLSVLRNNLIMNVRDLEEGAANLLSHLRPEVEFTAFNVREWNEDAVECNDNEIQEISDDDDDDCSVEPAKTITSREAIHMFDKTLEWAEYEMVGQSDLNVLKKLREKAVFKMLEQKKQQKRITDFFST